MKERLLQVVNHPLHCHLGVTEARSEDGGGSFTFTVGDATVNPADALHGGVVYLLCDVCAYLGLLSVLDDDMEAVTHDIHVSVLRAAGRGDVVRMASRILKKGKSLCFIDVSATVAGQLIATARITKSLIRKTA
ncbi:MAG: PaaI family thioesterase [Smithellaceae bacterium]